MKASKFIIPLFLLSTCLVGCGEESNPDPGPIDPPKPEVINVESVAFNEKTFTLDINESVQSNVTVLPENATNKLVTYSSNHSEFVSVDDKGLLTGIAEGRATITVTSDDGGFTDTCIVDVIDSLMKNISVEYNQNYFRVSASTNRCHVGDTVRLDFTNLHKGYDFADFTAVDTVTEEAVELTKIDSKTYTFVVPESCSIRVIGNYTPKPLKIYFLDEQSLLNELPTQSSDGEEFVDVDDSGTEGIYKYFTVKYGYYVKFQFAQQGLINPTSISLDGEEIALNENKEVSFKAELEDFTDFFFTVVVNYETLTPPAEPVAITIGSIRNVTTKVYKADKTTEITNKSTDVYTGDTIYINSFGKTTDIVIPEVVCSYAVNASNTKYEYATHEKEDGWFSYVVPTSSDNKLTIKGYKINDTQLAKNPEVVGEYLYFNVPSEESGTINELADDVITIGNNGVITCNGVKTYLNSIIDGIATTALNEKVEIHDGWMMFSLNNKGEVVESRRANPLMAFKTLNSSDSKDLYSIEGEKFVVKDNAYMSLIAKRDSVAFASPFYDVTGGHVWLNAEYDLMNGDSISASDAVYYVKADGEDIVGFGFDSKGKVLITRPMGAYMYEDELLLITNAYVATIGEKRYSWTKDGDDSHLVLKNSAETVNISLNIASHTFSVSDTAQADYLPEFNGRTFFMQKHEGESGSFGSTEVIFHTKVSDAEYLATFKSYYDANNCYIFETEVVVDHASQLVTFTFISQNIGLLFQDKLDKREYVVTGTYSDMTITFHDDLCNAVLLNGSSVKCYEFVY